MNPTHIICCNICSPTCASVSWLFCLLPVFCAGLNFPCAHRWSADANLPIVTSAALPMGPSSYSVGVWVDPEPICSLWMKEKSLSLIWTRTNIPILSNTCPSHYRPSLLPEYFFVFIMWQDSTRNTVRTWSVIHHASYCYANSDRVCVSGEHPAAMYHGSANIPTCPSRSALATLLLLPALIRAVAM